jgi:hypothetical protein
MRVHSRPETSEENVQLVADNVMVLLLLGSFAALITVWCKLRRKLKIIKLT